MPIIKDNPIVSVRIVTYNQEKWIAECLESVLKQNTNFEFEIVIGVDASTDNTLPIVKEYAKNYPDKIRVIEYKKRIGPFLNAKHTLEKCTGDFIAFMNGDDYWHCPSKLQKQVDFLRSNSGYAMVHSDYNIYYQTKKKTVHNIHKRSRRRISSGYIYEELLQKNFVGTSTVLIEKELLKSYDNYDLYINENFKMGDYPRWLEISRHTKIGYFDISLTTYRILDESESQSQNMKYKIEFLNSINNIRNYFIKKYGCANETRQKVKYDYLRRMLVLGSLSSQKQLAHQTYNQLQNFESDFIESIKFKLYLLLSYFKFITKFVHKFIRV